MARGASAPTGAPRLDFVFTVCDQAAGEACPFWPGQPMTAHWGVEDPAAVQGADDEKRRAFLAAFRLLGARVRLFASLRPELLERTALQAKVREIGRAGTEAKTE
jgi:arsenate reductase